MSKTNAKTDQTHVNQLSYSLLGTDMFNNVQSWHYPKTFWLFCIWAIADRPLGSLTSKFLHIWNTDFEIYIEIHDNTIGCQLCVWNMGYQAIWLIWETIIQKHPLSLSTVLRFLLSYGKRDRNMNDYIHTQWNTIRIWVSLMKMQAVVFTVKNSLERWHIVMLQKYLVLQF